MKKQILILFIITFVFFFNICYINASNNLIETKTDGEVIFIKDDNGKFLYSWTFDKEEYNKDRFEFDLNIKFKSPYEKEIKKLVKQDIKLEYVSFNYHGNLPSSATVKIPISKFKEDERLNLYYYNDETEKIETIKTNIRVINGYATFTIDHCSDYFLTKAMVKEAESVNKNNGIIIIAMIIVIVGLIGYTMFKNKK